MLENNCKAVTNSNEISANRKKLRLSATPLLELTKNEFMKYTFQSILPQTFSLPKSIIYYIARNPSFPNGHLKLISSCKCLARISRIFPVETVFHCYNDDCEKWNVGYEELINLKTNYFKLWIYDVLLICSTSLSSRSSILVKDVYKFSLREITLQNQRLTFGELQILVSGGKLENVNFSKNVIKNDDGSITEFEKVFELLCCKNLTILFHPEQHGVGKITTNKIIEILSSDQILDEQIIILHEIPQDFDFNSFSKFLKANLTGRKHTIDLWFADGISDAYKNQLQQFVNEIIQITGIYAHAVPRIYFPDQDDNGYAKLREMRYESVKGILRKS